ILISLPYTTLFRSLVADAKTFHGHDAHIVEVVENGREHGLCLTLEMGKAIKGGNGSGECAVDMEIQHQRIKGGIALGIANADDRNLFIKGDSALGNGGIAPLGGDLTLVWLFEPVLTFAIVTAATLFQQHLLAKCAVEIFFASVILNLPPGSRCKLEAIQQLLLRQAVCQKAKHRAVDQIAMIGQSGGGGSDRPVFDFGGDDVITCS